MGRSVLTLRQLTLGHAQRTLTTIGGGQLLQCAKHVNLGVYALLDLLKYHALKDISITVMFAHHVVPVSSAQISTEVRLIARLVTIKIRLEPPLVNKFLPEKSHQIK